MKRKIIYAITLLLGLSLFSFYAKAQNWQAYKGLWLKGYDNAAQAPVPPSGYSALTYFADSLGTYVYDWDSLAWLRIPGAGSGGGGGGLMTADNGLSVNPAGNVQLGGALLASTNITGTGAQNLNFGTTTNPLNLFAVNTDNNISLGRQETTTLFNRLLIGQASSSFNVQFNASRKSTYTFGGVNAFFDVADNSEKVRLDLRTSSNNEILLTSDSSSVISRFRVLPDKIRLESDNVYLSKSPVELDTAVWFLARDFNTGAIVQRKASGGGGGFTTADNGLTASSATNVQLGGTLIQNTTIPLAGFSYTVGQFPDNVNFSVDDASNTITANLSAGSNGALFSMTASNAVLQHSGSSGSATLTLDQSTETATISSSSGSSLDMDVSSAGGVDVNSSGSLDLATPTVRVELQSGVDRVVMRNPGTSTSFIRFDILNNDPEIMLAGSAQSQVSAIAGNTFVVKSRNNASGANNSGDLHLHTGDVLSGKAGDISIQTGAVSSGTNGNIIIDARAGFIIINPASLPTTDPCGSAPSGTIWSNSGVLNVCP